MYHEPKEPKDPPLISNFLRKMKLQNMSLPPSDRCREAALNLSKKKFMSKGVEEKLLDGKAKEFFREKRLKRKLSKKQI